jgi:hypothetical protein
VLSEEFFLFLVLDLVLLEELLENLMRVIGSMWSFKVLIARRNIVHSDLPCWHVNLCLKREEGIMKIEQGPQIKFSHLVFDYICYFNFGNYLSSLINQDNSRLFLSYLNLQIKNYYATRAF